MARFEKTPPVADEAAKRLQEDQVLLALLRERTKAKAAEAARVSLRTVFRYLADPAFMERYRAARRSMFDGALAALEKNAENAALRLVDEMDLQTCSGIKRAPNLISAAKGVLDRAFKAQSSIALEEELASMRILMDQLKTEQPVTVIHGPPSVEEIHMAEDEQAEAARLRVCWMAEIGFDGHAIESSLRYNRPQTVEEEKYLLDAVRKLVEHEAEEERFVAANSGAD